MMDQLERFLLVASGDELTGRPTAQPHDVAVAVMWRSCGAAPLLGLECLTPLAGTLGSNGPQWQEWTSERTAYLGTVLQKMLRGYTEAAVSVTSTLVTFVSRFALQVCSKLCR